MSDPKQTSGELAITRAAATLALRSGGDQTLADVLHSRALQHHAEELREYLTLRLGSIERGKDAMSALKVRIGQMGAERLAEPPGIRARLYREAREIARALGSASGQEKNDEKNSERDALPFRESARPDLSAALLEALRFGLPAELRELLELRHLRGLSPRELAFVVDRPLEAIYEALDTGSDELRQLNGEGRLLPLRQLLSEALALVTPEARGSQPDDVSSGMIIGGRYAIEARVGLGAFGDVYRAKDTEVENHIVALKLLHQPARSELERQTALKELRSIASVFHPSIVQFKDHGWFEGRLWFVMPWYEGETLTARIDRGPLSRAEALEIFQPLAEALDAMHAAGVRHQDVKPDNIFLARLPGFYKERALPILLDLGVAAKEAEMVVAGTPSYFAPEVAAQFAKRDQKPALTPRTDIFSLALSLRNALEPSLRDEIPPEEVEAFINERADTSPEPPRAKKLRYLKPHFERWLSLDAEERPTAAEMAEELEILVEPERRRARRKMRLQAAIPLVSIAAVALFIVGSLFQAHIAEKAAEAERAQQQIEGLASDLAASEQRSAEVEEHSQRIAEEYERSQLSRQELSRRIARIEAEKSQADARARTLSARLESAQGTLESTQETLNARLQDLRRERTRADELRERLSESESREEALERERVRQERILQERAEALASLKDTTHQLEAQIETLSSRLDAERRKSDELERSLEEAIKARRRLERELQRERSSSGASAPSTGSPAGSEPNDDQEGAPFPPADAESDGPV